MIRWFIITLIVIAAVIYLFDKSGIISVDYESYQENTTSLKDTGKIIKGLEEMKKKREADIKESEQNY